MMRLIAYYLDKQIMQDNMVIQACIRIFIGAVLLNLINIPWVALEKLVYGEAQPCNVDSIIAIIFVAALTECFVRYRKWKMAYFTEKYITPAREYNENQNNQ